MRASLRFMHLHNNIMETHIGRVYRKYDKKKPSIQNNGL